MLYQMVNHNNTDKDTRKEIVFLGFYSNYQTSSTHTIKSSDLFKLLKSMLHVLLKQLQSKPARMEMHHDFSIDKSSNL